ncbi:MAG: DUF1501 domain-containing protein [Alteromonadaceae bacterium]|nr:DUF1501 domain-containing protein [Alteromonadaceae bacterium]
MKHNQLSRRRFLRHSGHALSAMTLAGTAQLGAMAKASAQSNSEYKALVCVLLAGGADSFNMLVPTDNTHYQEYANTRTDLALAQNQLLALNGAQNNGRTLGLHPAMTGLQSLFNSGNLAFLSNVGTLVQPTTTQALANGTAKLPLGLYSHSDQISQWQTAVPDFRSGTGWGGRMADILASQNSNQRISMSISTSGANEFQAGRATDYYSVGTPDFPTATLEGAAQSLGNKSRQDAIDQMYSSEYNNLFRRAYRKLFNDSSAANAEFSAALQGTSNFTTQFAGDEFSTQMQMVAKTIAAHQTLGMQRQTFFVTLGGWDHHDELTTSLQTLLTMLDAGLSSLQQAINELGMANQVTTFTTSDFARTLSSNGRGSDHGWGGNAMIMGGSVRGGSVYGTYPSLALGNPLDTGRGVLMPTTSLDEYFAELALWFGVAPSVLNDILPNLNRFYSAGTNNPAPIGFMS